jgi:hypothetical protein
MALYAEGGWWGPMPGQNVIALTKFAEHALRYISSRLTPRSGKEELLGPPFDGVGLWRLARSFWAACLSRRHRSRLVNRFSRTASLPKSRSPRFRCLPRLTRGKSSSGSVCLATSACLTTIRAVPRRALQIAARFNQRDGIIHVPKVKPSHSYDKTRLLVEAGLQGWLCIPSTCRARPNAILGFDALQAGALTQWTEVALFRMAFDAISSAVGRAVLER